jgi:peptidyl-prolyl cis-trans isomerase B (cyclophilin B)
MKMAKPSGRRAMGALAIFLCCGLLAGCGSRPASAGQAQSETESRPASAWQAQSETESRPAADTTNLEEERFVMVEITMENGGVIKLELDREAAPITVDNFVSLVEDGFYDGLVFHRVVQGFMIQGGRAGNGAAANTIKGEFAANGWENPIKHTRGVISMARTDDPNSAGSQFFIVHQTSPHLDGSYAAFGKVVEGMEVVDAIAETETGTGDLPKTPQVITSIRVVG